MLYSAKTKGMVILLLFLGATAISAAPTINDSDGNTFLCAGSSDAQVYPCYGPDISNITGLYNSHLDSISKEFHKPPVTKANLPNTSMEVKSLPATPKTLLMVLLGFLCVSLVKDRRIWLTALAGLFWAGQAGVSFLPQLAANVAGRGRSENLTSSHHINHLNANKHPSRLRSDIEGTCYIGLLRHLEGIPNHTASIIPYITARRKLQKGSGKFSLSFSYRSCFSDKSLKTFCYNKPSGSLKNNLQKENRYSIKASHFAIAALFSHLYQVKECLAPVAGQHVIYSSVFIIASLARGPPNFKLIVKLFSHKAYSSISFL